MVFFAYVARNAAKKFLYPLGALRWASSGMAAIGNTAAIASTERKSAVDAVAIGGSSAGSGVSVVSGFFAGRFATGGAGATFARGGLDVVGVGATPATGGIVPTAGAPGLARWHSIRLTRSTVPSNRT